MHPLHKRGVSSLDKPNYSQSAADILLLHILRMQLECLHMYTVLQSKRANFEVFKVFCYIQESMQEGSILSLWEGTISTCTALWEVTCCHVT